MSACAATTTAVAYATEVATTATSDAASCAATTTAVAYATEVATTATSDAASCAVTASCDGSNRICEHTT
jgi:mRNA-degrading endonuclease toxin of MazEF toxin-antitoxin module